VLLGIPRGEACVGEGVVELGVELGRVDDLAGELGADYGAGEAVPATFRCEFERFRRRWGAVGRLT